MSPTGVTCLLVLSALACGGNAATAQMAIRLPPFCSFKQPKETNPRWMQNQEGRRLPEILAVSVQHTSIEARSSDWKDAAEQRTRLSEVLTSIPGTLSSGIVWSEIVDETHRRLVATIDSTRSIRIDIAGNHVCIQDATGQTWFFRTLEVDGWRR